MTPTTLTDAVRKEIEGVHFKLVGEPATYGIQWDIEIIPLSFGWTLSIRNDYNQKVKKPNP